MDKFLDDLVAALKAVGIANASHQRWDQYITIAGVRLDASRRSGSATIRFEGKSFRGPNFNMGNVVLHVLDILPKKLEEQKKREERNERWEEVKKLSSSISGTSMTVDHYCEKWILRIDFKDKLDLMAAADSLQDGGFLADSSPKADEEDFAMDWARRAFSVLSQEEKDSLLKELTGKRCTDCGVDKEYGPTNDGEGMRCPLCGE